MVTKYLQYLHIDLYRVGLGIQKKNDFTLREQCLHPLGHTLQHGRNLKYYLLEYIYYKYKYAHLAYICVLNHLTKYSHCYVKSSCITTFRNYSIILIT